MKKFYKEKENYNRISYENIEGEGFNFILDNSRESSYNNFNKFQSFHTKIYAFNFYFKSTNFTL